MFDEVVLTAAEHEAYVIARLETEFGAEYPDPAAFVTDEHQRFLDSRARLLSTGAAHLDGAVAASRDASRAEAFRARKLTAFARSRPAALFDRAPGERGGASAASIAARPAALTGVSEWAVDEAAATLGISPRAASLLLVEAVTLVEGLPATLAALSAGAISPAHARALVELAGPVADAGRRARVEAAVLPRATAGQTVQGLRACLRRAVARIDAAAAADRLVKAVRDRQVRLEVRDDGMSALVAVWATPVGRACYEMLSAYATACEYDEDGNRDPRSHEQRLADCLSDLILRPHADRPPVQLALTLIAGVDTLTGQGDGADQPGEIDGDLVPAPLVRELAHTFGLLPRPEPAVDEAEAPDAPEADTPDIAEAPDGRVADTPGMDGERDARIAALRAAELAATEHLLTARAAVDPDPEVGAGGTSASRAALLRLLDTRRLIDTALAPHRRRRPAHGHAARPHRQHGVASGRRLGPPPATDAYRPTDPLHRYVKLRDRRCRFPGCRIRARCCDLDHQVPHPRGATAHDNLACLCEHHHRLSHQAPGWRLHRDPDGRLVWTLPSGRTVTTRPPAFGTDDGSTTTALPRSRTGRERYDDALAAIRNSRPVAANPHMPF